MISLSRSTLLLSASFLVLGGASSFISSPAKASYVEVELFSNRKDSPYSSKFTPAQEEIWETMTRSVEESAYQIVHNSNALGRPSYHLVWQKSFLAHFLPDLLKTSLPRLSTSTWNPLLVYNVLSYWSQRFSHLHITSSSGNIETVQRSYDAYKKASLERAIASASYQASKEPTTLSEKGGLRASPRTALSVLFLSLKETRAKTSLREAFKEALEQEGSLSFNDPYQDFFTFKPQLLNEITLELSSSELTSLNDLRAKFFKEDPRPPSISLGQEAMFKLITHPKRTVSLFPGPRRKQNPKRGNITDYRTFWEKFFTLPHLLEQEEQEALTQANKIFLEERDSDPLLRSLRKRNNSKKKPVTNPPKENKKKKKNKENLSSHIEQTPTLSTLSQAPYERAQENRSGLPEWNQKFEIFKNNNGVTSVFTEKEALKRSGFNPEEYFKDTTQPLYERVLFAYLLRADKNTPQVIQIELSTWLRELVERGVLMPQAIFALVDEQDPQALQGIPWGVKEKCFMLLEFLSFPNLGDELKEGLLNKLHEILFLSLSSQSLEENWDLIKFLRSTGDNLSYLPDKETGDPLGQKAFNKTFEASLKKIMLSKDYLEPSSRARLAWKIYKEKDREAPGVKIFLDQTLKDSPLEGAGLIIDITDSLYRDGILSSLKNVGGETNTLKKLVETLNTCLLKLDPNFSTSQVTLHLTPDMIKLLSRYIFSPGVESLCPERNPSEDQNDPFVMLRKFRSLSLAHFMRSDNKYQLFMEALEEGLTRSDPEDRKIVQDRIAVLYKNYDTQVFGPFSPLKIQFQQFLHFLNKQYEPLVQLIHLLNQPPKGKWNDINNKVDHAVEALIKAFYHNRLDRMSADLLNIKKTKIIKEICTEQVEYYKVLGSDLRAGFKKRLLQPVTQDTTEDDFVEQGRRLSYYLMCIEHSRDDSNPRWVKELISSSTPLDVLYELKHYVTLKVEENQGNWIETDEIKKLKALQEGFKKKLFVEKDQLIPLFTGFNIEKFRQARAIPIPEVKVEELKIALKTYLSDMKIQERIDKETNRIQQTSFTTTTSDQRRQLERQLVLEMLFKALFSKIYSGGENTSDPYNVDVSIIDHEFYMPPGLSPPEQRTRSRKGVKKARKNFFTTLRFLQGRLKQGESASYTGMWDAQGPGAKENVLERLVFLALKFHKELQAAGNDSDAIGTVITKMGILINGFTHCIGGQTEAIQSLVGAYQNNASLALTSSRSIPSRVEKLLIDFKEDLFSRVFTSTDTQNVHDRSRDREILEIPVGLSSALSDVQERYRMANENMHLTTLHTFFEEATPAKFIKFVMNTVETEEDQEIQTRKSKLEDLKRKLRSYKAYKESPPSSSSSTSNSNNPMLALFKQKLADLQAKENAGETLDEYEKGQKKQYEIRIKSIETQAARNGASLPTSTTSSPSNPHAKLIKDYSLDQPVSIDETRNLTKKLAAKLAKENLPLLTFDQMKTLKAKVESTVDDLGDFAGGVGYKNAVLNSIEQNPLEGSGFVDESEVSSLVLENCLRLIAPEMQGQSDLYEKEGQTLNRYYFAWIQEILLKETDFSKKLKMAQAERSITNGDLMKYLNDHKEKIKDIYGQDYMTRTDEGEETLNFTKFGFKEEESIGHINEEGLKVILEVMGIFNPKTDLSACRPLSTGLNHSLSGSYRHDLSTFYSTISSTTLGQNRGGSDHYYFWTALGRCGYIARHHV